MLAIQHGKTNKENIMAGLLEFLSSPEAANGLGLLLLALGLMAQDSANGYTGLDNFNQNMMPGLMDFANQMMTSRYERQRGGPAGSGAGYGGGVVPGGMRSGGVGPFSAPQMQSYGLLDWNALNPFANGVAGTPKV